MAVFKKKPKAVQVDPWQAGVEHCTAHFTKVARLQAENSVSSRRELKRMREVVYDTDPTPSPGKSWNPEGKQFVKGSSNKHATLMSAHNARQKQGVGINYAAY